MCKLNHKFLILFGLYVQMIQISVTSPLGSLLFDDYIDEPIDGDYDLHYDERQNGTENYRLNINGVVIAVPGASSDAMNSIGMLASNYLLELAGAAVSHDQESTGNYDGTDDNPYDFEIPTGSQENNDEDTDKPEPVIIISGDPIVKPLVEPTTSEPNAQEVNPNIQIQELKPSVSIQDLKPENNVDAITEKEEFPTNKKDLNIEIAKDDDILKVTKDKSSEEVKIKKSVAQEATRRVSSNGGRKRRNKLKFRIRSLIDYLKRSRD